MKFFNTIFLHWISQKNNNTHQTAKILKIRHHSNKHANVCIYIYAVQRGRKRGGGCMGISTDERGRADGGRAQSEEAGRTVSWEVRLKKKDPQSAVYIVGGEPSRLTCVI